MDALNVARISSDDNTIINIEMASQEWVDEQNAEHDRNSSLPYFVVYSPNQRIGDDVFAVGVVYDPALVHTYEIADQAEFDMEFEEYLSGKGSGTS